MWDVLVVYGIIIKFNAEIYPRVVNIIIVCVSSHNNVLMFMVPFCIAQQQQGTTTPRPLNYLNKFQGAASPSTSSTILQHDKINLNIGNSTVERDHISPLTKTLIADNFVAPCFSPPVPGWHYSSFCHHHSGILIERECTEATHNHEEPHSRRFVPHAHVGWVPSIFL